LQRKRLDTLFLQYQTHSFILVRTTGLEPAQIAPWDPKSLCTSCNYVLEFEENAHFIEKSQVRDRIANLLREAF